MLSDALDRPVIRYTLASAAALALDFALTFALRIWTPLSLTASAAIGFAVVSVAFYFVHEFWSFRRDTMGVSGVRLAQNLLVLSVAFLGRVGTIAGLDWLYPSNIPLGIVYFAIGVAVSFSTNFLLNRYWVFKSAA